MKRTLRTVLALLLAASFGSAALAQTSSTPPCILGYTVGFFNGVGNTEFDAMTTLNQTRASIQEVTGNTNDTFNNEDVQYQVFYNTTGSVTFLQDIAETFAQRQQQIDPSGFFSTNNLYMVWEEINGGGSFNYLAYTTENQGFASFFEDAASAIATALAGEIGSLAANEPTQQNYATQNAQLDALAAAGRKLLLVAHSQGNLFVDQAYDHIQPVVGSTRVKVVHVAPASPTLRGQYILSTNDAVINAVRLISGYPTIPNNNITIAFANYEPTGHSMGPTYLDTTPGRTNGRAQTEQLELAGLQALTAPSGCAVKLNPTSSTLNPGGTQTFTATLNPTPDDTFLLTEYTWTVTGNAGGTLPGGFTTLNTSTPNVVYTAPSSAKGGSQDTLTVKVQASKTQGDQVNAVTLGTGTATVSISNISVGVSPSKVNINTGQSTTFSATVSGAGANPPGSYLWTTTGAYGTLSGTGAINSVSGSKSFCSSSPQVTYNTTVPSPLAAGPNYTNYDSVTVQVFADTACGATTNSTALASAYGLVYVTFVKDVSAWVGTWSTCYNPNTSIVYYINVYGKPFPQQTNVVDSGNGADLLFLIQNYSNYGESYLYVDVVGNNTTLGFDDRYPTYDAANAAGYSVLSNTGGTLTITNRGQTYLSCSR